MEVVTAAVVANEIEAEVACGLLRSNGIRCAPRRTHLAGAAWESVGSAGPWAVLVAPLDLDRAKELLAG